MAKKRNENAASMKGKLEPEVREKLIAEGNRGSHSSNTLCLAPLCLILSSSGGITELFGRNHLSNTTRLTHAFFNSGE